MKKKAAKKKPRAIQETFPDVDMRERERVAHSMEVDLTERAIGSSIGDGLVVFACPMCGDGCLPKRDRMGISFVHKGELQSTDKTVKWQPDRACRMRADDVTDHIAHGTLKIDKTGKVTSTAYRRAS